MTLNLENNFPASWNIVYNFALINHLNRGVHKYLYLIKGISTIAI